jgi:hypothetical protein
VSDAGAPEPDLAGIAGELLAEAYVAGSWRIVAVGWATVDLERAAAELEGRWPAFAPIDAVPPSGLLGARARLGRVDAASADADRIALVLLEPTTEGRLAASLARHGEGPAAVWLVGPTPAEDDGGPRTSMVADGPLGRERLVLGGPVAGPHVLLVHRSPGTIDR